MMDPRMAIAHALAEAEDQSAIDLADNILLALANEGYDPEDHISRDQQQELYEVYRMARIRTGCDGLVCKRLRQKRWDDQNDLVPGRRTILTGCPVKDRKIWGRRGKAS